MEFKFIEKSDFFKYLPLIEDLYRESFNSGKEINYFKWRYLDNPYGDLQIIVAIDNGKMASFYAVSPKEILYNGEKIKTAISLNTMTSEKYRGKGLFVTLADKLYERMSESGYEMVWGYPNNISHRTFIDKLGWENIYEIPTLEIKKNDINLNLLEIDDKINVLTDNSFDYNYNKLPTVRSNFTVYKDNDILRWRYLNNPNNDYFNSCIVRDGLVSSYIVSKIYNHTLNIIDYRYSTTDEFFIIFKSIVTDLNYNLIDKITIWNNISSDIRNRLEKLGFSNNYPIRYFGGKILSSKVKKNDFINWRNWNLNMGDNNEY